MSASVIVRSAQDGSMPVRGQSGMLPMRAAPHFGSVGRDFRAICRAGLFAHRQGRGEAGVLKPGHPSLNRSPSAAWILIGGVIPVASSFGRCIAGARCVVARPRLSYLSRPFGLPGNPLQRIAIQLRQKSFRGCAQAFHFVLSAGGAGLVAHCDGHTVERKEMTCPTRDGSNMTRNRAFAS